MVKYLSVEDLGFGLAQKPYSNMKHYRAVRWQACSGCGRMNGNEKRCLTRPYANRFLAILALLHTSSELPIHAQVL